MERKLLFILVTVFTLQPILSMEPDEKKLKTRETINECPPALHAPCLEEMNAWIAQDRQKKQRSLDTRLRNAAVNGNIIEAQELLAAGAQIYASANFTCMISSQSQMPLGYTGLTSSLSNPQEDAQVEFYHINALELAHAFHHDNIVMLFIKHSDQQAIFNELLRAMGKHGFSKLSQFLLENLSDISAENDNGTTLLLINAVIHGESELCKLLLERGAHFTPASTPWLLMQSSEDVLSLLIEYGANINAQDQDGNTALLLIMNQGEIYLDDCELLLQYGADPDIANHNGKRALDWVEEKLVASVAERNLLADANWAENDTETYTETYIERYNDIIDLLANPERIEEVRTRHTNNPPVEMAFAKLKKTHLAHNLCQAVLNRELACSSEPWRSKGIQWK